MNPAMKHRGPQRIVCMTEETCETLYLLGEDARIVGISGFTARPKQARQEKPKVSAFTSAKIDKILELRPDLVLGFSDMQAQIAADLIRAGVNVMIFNQRSIEEIFDAMMLTARMVGAEAKGLALVDKLRAELAKIAQNARKFAQKPRVFFEEWNDPLISGICWVDELAEIAGGVPIFPSLRKEPGAKNRIVDADAVAAANPQVIIASWCGRKVNKQQIRSRPGWEAVDAVRGRHIYEIKSTYILQPGPAALTEGVRQLHAILARVAGCEVPPELAPEEAMDPALDVDRFAHMPRTPEAIEEESSRVERDGFVNSDFSAEERRAVYRAIYERRDIRSHFLPAPIPDDVLGRVLDAAHHAPSVGFMQPWDFIVIRDEAVRRAMHECFVEANRCAAERYEGSRRAMYDRMKLAGVLDAPVNLCITCDRERTRGAGLGRQTDPATDLYSTVCAVENLWLAARVESLGVGWVSILDFDRLRAVLEIPENLVPVAYLCMGYVSEFPARPELETNGWESRESLARLIHFDRWNGRDEQRARELAGAMTANSK